MKTKKTLLMLALIVTSYLVGCIGSQSNVRMTQDEIALWMNGTYMAQVRDYKTWFVVDQSTGKFAVDPATGKNIFKPGTPDKQKQVLRDKKKIFDELYPLLKAYNTYVITGTTEPGVVISQVQSQAVKLINQLLIMDRQGIEEV